MTKADERILEYLAVVGNAQPSMIANDDRIEFDNQYINQRLWKLTDAGLTQKVGRGVYRLTDRGEAYLDGEFDARELGDPDEGDS